ncbi:uncharacterized protein [Clytia hemisphaerica]|uniref:Uncharacterized protein n=1 Tax=Clytia hemisphaerica TaxID=252671 RepID=A0A7M5V9C6_9CNID
MDVYVHSLRYEVDHETEQACFYVDQCPEVEQQKQTFLWQSQNWIVTLYDVSQLPVPVRPTGTTHRTVRRQAKGDTTRYVVTEYLYENHYKAGQPLHQLKEFVWKPKDVSTLESYLLVTLDEEQDICQQLVGESELHKSFTQSYCASLSGLEDFEHTYDEEQEKLLESIQLQEKPVGGLARLTYVAEKLVHVVDGEVEDTHTVKPINIKLQYNEPKMWVEPYEGNYGLDTSHFQISERFGDSVGSSLLQIRKRGVGRYLSDFSFSLSDVRRMRRFQKKDYNMDQAKYADLPADVVVVDSVKPRTKTDEDDEDFEDLSIDFENLNPKKTEEQRQPSVKNTKKENIAVENKTPPATLLSMKINEKKKTDISPQNTVGNPVKKKTVLDHQRGSRDKELSLKSVELSLPTVEEDANPQDMPEMIESPLKEDADDRSSDICDSGYEENSPDEIKTQRNDHHQIFNDPTFQFNKDSFVRENLDEEIILSPKNSSTKKPNVVEQPSPTDSHSVRPVMCEVYSHETPSNKVTKSVPLKETLINDEPSIEPITKDADQIDFSALENIDKPIPSTTPRIELDNELRELKNMNFVVDTQVKDVNDEVVQPKLEKPSSKDIISNTELDSVKDEMIIEPLPTQVINIDSRIEKDNELDSNSKSTKSYSKNIVVDENDIEIESKDDPIPEIDLEERLQRDELQNLIDIDNKTNTLELDVSDEEILDPSTREKKELSENDSSLEDVSFITEHLTPQVISIATQNEDTSTHAKPQPKSISTDRQPILEDDSKVQVDSDETRDIIDFDEFTKQQEIEEGENALKDFVSAHDNQRGVGDVGILDKEEILDPYSRDRKEFPPKDSFDSDTGSELVHCLAPEAISITQPEDTDRSVDNDRLLKKPSVNRERIQEDDINERFDETKTSIIDLEELVKQREIEEGENELKDFVNVNNGQNEYKNSNIDEENVLDVTTRDKSNIKISKRHVEKVDTHAHQNIRNVSVNIMHEEHNTVITRPIPARRPRKSSSTSKELITEDENIEIKQDSTPSNIDLDLLLEEQPPVRKTSTQTEFRIMYKYKDTDDQQEPESPTQIDPSSTSSSDSPSFTKVTVRSQQKPRSKSSSSSVTFKVNSKNDKRDYDIDDNDWQEAFDNDQSEPIDDSTSQSSSPTTKISTTSLRVSSGRPKTDFLPTTTEHDQQTSPQTTPGRISFSVKDQTPKRHSDSYIDLDGDENGSIESDPKLEKKKSIKSKAKKFVLQKLHKQPDAEATDVETTKKNRKSSFKRFGSSIKAKISKRHSIDKTDSIEQRDSSTPTKKGLIGIQRLKYDDEEDNRVSVSERAQIYRRFESIDETDGAKPRMVRSRSFDSILDTRSVSELEKVRNEQERRRHLAGYSFVNRDGIPKSTAIVKGRDYSTIDAIYRETEHELTLIRQQRRRKINPDYSRSIELLDDIEEDKKREREQNTERELQKVRSVRRKRPTSNKRQQSMDVPLSALQQMRLVGRVDIPGVFKGSPPVERHPHEEGGKKLDGGSVGRLKIPRAFSVENLLDD